jgi:hypothetical protein
LQGVARTSITYFSHALITLLLLQPNQGALTVDAQAVDATFSIENISFYKDSKLATDLTAEADWARRGLYIGPQVSLQGISLCAAPILTPLRIPVPHSSRH